MPEHVQVVVPLFIDVADVMRSMKCSRSRAYEHMRAALGRRPGERGQSRVPLYVWERYVRERFDPALREAPATSMQVPKAAGTLQPLRITRPRTAPRNSAAESAVLQSPRVSDDPTAC
jgi:hypothetical protein